MACGKARIGGLIRMGAMLRHKKAVRVVVAVLLVLAMVVPLVAGGISAQAAVVGSINNLVKIESKSDLDNFVTGESNPIGYQASMDGGVAVLLDMTTMKNGTIKVRFNVNFDVFTAVSASIVREQDLYNSQKIVPDTPITSKQPNLVAWLDGGQKYYLRVVAVPKAIKDQDINDPMVMLTRNTGLSISVGYEEAESDEIALSTSRELATKLTMGNLAKGFITYEAPIDYYTFTIGDKESIILYYTFDGPRNVEAGLGGNGEIEVVDSNNALIGSDKVSVSVANKTSEFKLTLEELSAGTYYVRLKGLYGATTLRYTKIKYDLELEPSTDAAAREVTIYVKTNMEYTDLRYTYGDIPDSEKESNKYWSNSNSIPIEGDKFTVDQSGTYTVRATDGKRNYILARINITNVDAVAPKISGVANGKSYRKGLIIKFSDAESGVKSATLGKDAVASGVRVADEGKYTLTVKDKVGNTTKATFYIDYTKPTIGGVQNGKNYATYAQCPSITYKDSLSGIKSVVIDGEPLNISKYPEKYSVVKKGDHSVTVTDNAGNVTTVKFSIGKK